MPRRVALLVNPTSGGGRGARAAAAALQRLREHGITVDQRVGADASQAAELARAAVADGYDSLVAVGGDGMVHLVLQAVAGTGVPLGLVPAGTGNDFARMLGLHRLSPAAAADVVATAAPRVVDAARVRAGDGPQRWFAGVLSSGFDSAVNERGNAMRWPRGRMRYNLAMVRELGAYRPVRFRIELDRTGPDPDVLEQDAMLVAVGNSASYGGGMRVTPGARLDDGLLDVTVVAAIPRTTFVRIFPRVYRGTHVEHPAVTVRRARAVRLSAAGVVAYADGERLGPLPVETECVPGALTVLSPASRAPGGRAT